MLASNTSTLVLLAKVGCLEAFIQMSPVIEIPIQVEREALFERESYYAKLINKLIKEEKIKVIKEEKINLFDIMAEFRLDEGEAAAYLLFNPKKHQAILTDDGMLIKLCKLQSIPFICAMAVIIRLFEKKKLTKEEALNKLKDLNRIGRYSKELYEYFKMEIK